MKDSSKEKLKSLFVGQVRYLLQFNQFKGTALCMFLRHYAKRWQNSHIDLYEVIVEGVRRGIEYIEKNGKEIRSPEAWLRLTCLNILKDKINKTIREEKKVENISLIQCLCSTSSAQPELMEKLDYLDQAMKYLSEGDRLLIHLKFFEYKTYEQIQHYYLLLYGEEISIPALRKRESRAIKRLKNHFFTLYDGKSNSQSDLATT